MSVKVILFSVPVSELAMYSFAVDSVSSILEARTGMSVTSLIADATAERTSSSHACVRTLNSMVRPAMGQLMAGSSPSCA